MFGDVCSQRTQRSENTDVVLVVRPQLETVALGDLQREFQGIDGIQGQARLEQRRLRIDVIRRHAFEIEGGNDEFSELALVCEQ